jgi:hypothetical protein
MPRQATGSVSHGPTGALRAHVTIGLGDRPACTLPWARSDKKPRSRRLISVMCSLSTKRFQSWGASASSR